jgi:CRP/FNR family transcriptional regulator, cyclic AMP receptor protein
VAIPSIEEQLQTAGLQMLGLCADLAAITHGWRHEASLLEDLSAAEANALGALMPRVSAKPGQVLIREGEVGDWMLIILSGTVDVTKQTEQGHEDGDKPSRLAVVKQGAALGEMSMLDAAPRYATCTAIEQVEAAVLTRAAVAELIHSHPTTGAKVLVKLTQLLAQRLRNTSNQLVKLLQNTSK